MQSNDAEETIAKKEAKKMVMKRRRKNHKHRQARRNLMIKSKKSHVEMGKGSVVVVMDKVVEGEEEEGVVVEARRMATMMVDRNKKLRVALTHGKVRSRTMDRMHSKIATQSLHVPKKLRQCKMEISNINHETRELQKQQRKMVKSPKVENKGELTGEVEVVEEVVEVEEVVAEVAAIQAR